jgi:hypothetical protein
MRSSPANASVICVPIEAICTIGIAIRPVKKMYENQVAERHRPATNRAAAATA